MRINLSDQSVDALAEIISGGSANDPSPAIGLYRQGWRLEQFFQAFRVEFVLQGSSRVTATRAAIVGAMAWPDADDVLRKIIERAADPRDFVENPERLEAVLKYLNERFVFDDLKLERDGLRVRLVSASQNGSVVDTLSSKITQIDFDTVKRDLDRALRSADEDPEDAVTGACSVVESVCRSLLVALNQPLPAKKDLQSLYQAVRTPLGLAPDREGVSDTMAADVRTILGGLNAAVSGIGSLRTHAGDAHGRERGYRRIDPRIARLALHAASSVALFLVETWQQKFPSAGLPKN